MSKFKICPSCGEKNPPDALDCANCECDLMSIAVTDEEQEAAKKFIQLAPAEKNSFIKICECGATNLPNAVECSACGEDISDIIPTSSVVPAQATQIRFATFVLKSLDGRIDLRVDGEIIVGRENELKDYLATKHFVSRRHCKFTAENGELFVEDLKSANSTFVNKQRILAKTKLSKGDEVGLGDAGNGTRQDNAAYFMVE